MTVARWFLAVGLAGLAWANASRVSANRPAIEYIQPTSGPVGTVVEIVGRGLGGASRVRVGDTALEVVEAMPSRIRARVPEAATSGPVAVDTPQGTVSGPAFRVTAALPAPVIESIEPTRGAPGTHVTLRGKHFSARLSGNVVTLAGRPVVVHAATPLSIEVIVPDVASGGTFTVRVPRAGEATSSAVFEIVQGVEITGVEPPRAPPGSEITLRGRGFSSVARRNRVYLNNVELAVLRASETEVTVRVPDRATTGHLLVDVTDTGRARSPAPFVPQWLPSVVGFAPLQGAPGTLVTVRGTNFGDDANAVVARMGESALVVKEVHRTYLVVEIPVGASTDRLSIRVHGVGPAWSPVPFRVLSTIVIRDFAPRSGPAGTEVAIEGRGFQGEPSRNTVTIGGRPAEVIEASETKLRIRVPAGGSGAIEVRAPNGDRARARDAFVVTEPPAVDSALPLEGTVGTEIAIRGRGFGSTPALVRVTLGGHPLEVRSVRDDLVVARITPGAVSGRLRVHVRLQGAGELSDEVRVLGALTVTAVDPRRGAVGDLVTVRGSGFVPGSTRVEFGGVASEPKAIAPDKLRVVVPDGARSGILVVRLADGRNSPGPQPFSVAAVH